MEYRGSPGINKLAGILAAQMKKEAWTPLNLDFGLIGQDLSLQTDTFPNSIQKKDYMVCRGLAIGKNNACFAKIEQPHEHEVPVPESMRSLKPGDRVLVAWVQSEPVVVDIIVEASVLQEGGV